MASLLKKKNYKTTKGTKRWRKNIDASELEDKVIKNNQAKYEDVQLEEKLKTAQKVGFTISTEADKNIKKALEKDRFFKKFDESGISAQEWKKYRKLGKKIQKNKPQENKKVEKIEEPEELDTWKDETVTAPLISKKEKVAHLIVPTSGMSYNPSYKDHQELIEEAIALEDQEGKTKRLNVVKKIRKQNKDLKEFERISQLKKEASLNPVQRQKKEERKIAHLGNTIKKVKKEVLSQQKQLQEQNKVKQQDKEHEQKVKENLGFNFKPKKLGMKKFRQKGPDFVLEEDLPDNLRSVQQASNLLRDEYEAVFRKGMLEPKNYFKKDKKSRVAAIKHRQKFDPYFKNEWEDVETALKVNN